MHDFSGIDRVYDRLLGMGLRPVVELAYMPRDLARDPDHTSFFYKGVSSPPKDWDRWAELVRDLTQHLVDRYGRDEVRDHWAFEVWNEPNLEYFWSGDAAEYLRLYDTAVRAVRSVDAGLRVGGPSTAAVGWVEDLLAHTQKTDAPLDFVSTHLYGAPPWTCARPWLATAARTRPSGGRSGGPTRGCPTRWPSRCTRPRSWPRGCARPPAGSTPSPGGSPPTTSRSWGGRAACSTAGSGC